MLCYAGCSFIHSVCCTSWFHRKATWSNPLASPRFVYVYFLMFTQCCLTVNFLECVPIGEATYNCFNGLLSQPYCKVNIITFIIKTEEHNIKVFASDHLLVAGRLGVWTYAICFQSSHSQLCCNASCYTHTLQTQVLMKWQRVSLWKQGKTDSCTTNEKKLKEWTCNMYAKLFYLFCIK